MARPNSVAADRFAGADDLGRNVYCILGISIDATGITAATRQIEAAEVQRSSFLIATLNLNFLVIRAESDHVASYPAAAK